MKEGELHAQNEGQAFKRHILTKKTTKNKRHLRGSTEVAKADVKSIRSMLPYA